MEGGGKFFNSWVGIKAKENRRILIIPKHCQIEIYYNSRKYKNEKIAIQITNKSKTRENNRSDLVTQQ